MPFDVKSFSWSRNDILDNVGLGLSLASAQQTANTSTYRTYVFENKYQEKLHLSLSALQRVTVAKKKEKYFFFSVFAAAGS